MLESQVRLPVPLGFANAIWRSLPWSPFARLDEDVLRAAATKATGLTDFGDPYYEDGLARVLESAKKDAHLHLLGYYLFYRTMILSLRNRLLLTETRKRAPDVFRQPLIPPVIIFGLPRSGSTFLHRMLATDPTHRAIPMWELFYPIHNPGPTGDAPDQRRQTATKIMNVRGRLTPGIESKHMMQADNPEECMFMQYLTFCSFIFWASIPVYGYQEWYNQQDRLKPYQEYRWLLQILQAADPTRRLVLKAPAHTGALGALLQTVPNALLVQTHRNPVAACTSLNSLIYTVHGAMSDKLDVPRMAETNLRWLENEIALNLAARDAHPNAVYDVYYERLVADPIGTVRVIYEHFGLPWTDARQEQLQAHVRANPRGKHGAHRYSPADFGQADAVIAKRLAVYGERFGFVV